MFLCSISWQKLRVCGSYSTNIAKMIVSAAKFVEINSLKKNVWIKILIHFLIDVRSRVFVNAILNVQYILYSRNLPVDLEKKRNQLLWIHIYLYNHVYVDEAFFWIFLDVLYIVWYEQKWNFSEKKYSIII